MSFKTTLVWILIAGSLFAGIYFLYRHPSSPSAGPGKILPELDPAAITAVQVRPSGQGQLQIRAERRQGVWHLVEPLDYPAQGAQIDKLVNYLATLIPATYITPAEIRN